MCVYNVFVEGVAVVPICNVKNTLVTIIIFVLIISHVGVFQWTVHPPTLWLMCLVPYLWWVIFSELLLPNTTTLYARSLCYDAIDLVANMEIEDVAGFLFGMYG